MLPRVHFQLELGGRILQKYTDFSFLKSRDAVGLNSFWLHSFRSFFLEENLIPKPGITPFFSFNLQAANKKIAWSKRSYNFQNMRTTRNGAL